jgi:hypothetical protein
VTVDIPSDAQFVPTDERGRQFRGEEATLWSLPEPADELAKDGQAKPGFVDDPAPSGVTLLGLDELLDDLGARIFVADNTGDSPVLAAETAWSLRAAAGFALDCAEHVLGRQEAATEEIAGTLRAVVANARKWLDEAEDTDTGLLRRFSRMAVLRRLRRQGDQVASLALDFAVDAEAADVDLFDDPKWTAVAATRDAVLAAIEAIRHDSAPHLVETENARYETSMTVSDDAVSATFETPWGPFHAGLRKGVVPASVAAMEAAERARQSVGDSGGADAAAAERAWQRDRLLQALRGN